MTGRGYLQINLAVLDSSGRELDFKTVNLDVVKSPLQTTFTDDPTPSADAGETCARSTTIMSVVAC